MKPPIRYTAVIIGLLVLSSGCAATGGMSSQDSNSNKVVVNDPGMDLTGLLEQISGISVAGSGSNAIITIRTISSYSTGLATDYNFFNRPPLFVIDGEIIGHDYTRAYQKVNMRNVASINVLKRADALRYGDRGSSGVVEINYM